MLRRKSGLSAQSMQMTSEDSQKKSGHSGVLAIASGAGPTGQFDMTMAAINWVQSGSNSGAGFLNRYLEVDETGEIIFAEIHYGD
jgi:hypothetical protein